MKTKVLYNQKTRKQTTAKNQKYKTDTKPHLTFTSVKYVCGKILHIESMLNSYQTLIAIKLCPKKSSFRNI